MLWSRRSLWKPGTSAAGSLLNPCWHPFPFPCTSAECEQTQCPVRMDDVNRSLHTLLYLNLSWSTRAPTVSVWSESVKADPAHWTHYVFITGAASPDRFLWYQFLLVLDFKWARFHQEPTGDISQVQTLQKLWPLNEFSWIVHHWELQVEEASLSMVCFVLGLVH